jgi:hypothetical protein
MPLLLSGIVAAAAGWFLLRRFLGRLDREMEGY